MLPGAGVVPPCKPVRTSLSHAAARPVPDEDPPVGFPKRPSPWATRMFAGTLE
jgi:hypothetical protein